MEILSQNGSRPRALVPRIGVASVASPLEVGAGRAPEAAKELARLLAGCGCEVIELGPIDGPVRATAAGRQLAEQHVEAVALAAVSWFEDYLVLDLLEECKLPVMAWALPGMETGALCGCQQLTAFLAELGVPYRGVYGALETGANCSRALEYLHAAALKARLRRARVGLLGHRVPGMTETAANEFALKKALGPRVAPLDLVQLLTRAGAIPDEQARDVWQMLVARSAACQVPESEGLSAMRFHLALKELIARQGLAAVTVGCYPDLMGRPCLAASLLADEGIPLACEGDVNGAVGQLILTWLTGQPTHNTDWLEPLEDGSVVFTHCGSGSFSLAEHREEITLGPVRLMDRGVCALFPARPGPVTLVSLLACGNDYQVAVLEGEAISTTMVFPGNPLRVRFPVPTPRLIQWIFEEGIGHHWMAGYGHVAGDVRQWAKLCGPGLRLIDGSTA
jgi:L-fucose isomerase-like protein